MKRRFFLGGAAGLLLAARVRPADAIVPVICETCATWVDQLTSLARQAQQYATEIASYQKLLAMYQNQIQNTIALPQQVWSTVQGDLYQVRSLANAASVLTGNSGSMIQRLQSASGYASSATMLPAQFSQQIQMWQQTLGQADFNLGNQLALQQRQQLQYASLQDRAQAQSAAATGQMQAIQAGNELAAITGTQLNQIQATLTAQAQYYAAVTTSAADRTAREDAVMLDFANGHPVATTGYRNY